MSNLLACKKDLMFIQDIKFIFGVFSKVEHILNFTYYNRDSTLLISTPPGFILVKSIIILHDF